MKWAGRSALVVLSVLSVLAVAEGLLRFVGAARFGLQTWHAGSLYRPDPDLIFALRPSVRHRWSSAEFTEEASINRLGLRSGELLEPGTRPRILVLGDSQAYGHGVADDAPYPQRLQALFKARGEAVEVINAGMQGYSSDQSYKLFAKRLRKLKPDLVIFAHYWNDIPENVSHALYVIEDGKLAELDATGHPLYRMGRVHEMLPAWILELRLMRVFFAAMIGTEDEWLDASNYESRPVRWGRRKLFLQLRDLERMAREDGFALLLLTVPYRDGAVDYYRYLQRPLEGSGISVLDAQSHPQWKRAEARLFYREDDHLTELGHHRLARQLHGFIREEEFLPRAGSPAP
ncbi:MAG: hypothetical protein JRH19_20385 [Deltaproteobacteria bacterium]|nr:hypothetical protein [Deltaproteobacteria bacterium]